MLVACLIMPPSLDDFFAVKGIWDRSALWLETSSRLHATAEDRIGNLEFDYPADLLSLPMRVESGKKRTDLLQNTWALLIASPRFVKAFEATGGSCRCRPAPIYDRSDEKVIYEDAVWLTPPVGAGPVANTGFFEERKFQQRFPQPDEMRIWVGLHFDIGTWSGADVFMLPRVRGVMIVTARIGKELLKHQFEGIEIEPLPEYGRASIERQIAKMRNWPPKGR